MKNTIALLALLLPSLALAEAGPREVSLERNQLSNRGVAWDVFADEDGLMTSGIGIAQDLDKNLSVVASYHFGQAGSENYIPEDPGSAEGFVAAFNAHQFTAGVRGDLGGTGFVQPFVSAKATALLGIVRLDDDLDSDENLTQTQAMAIAPGGVLAVGLSGLIPAGPGHVRLDTELGYAHSLPMGIGELGSLQFSGFHMRWAAGLRF
jgi:hypothetical protein